MRNEDWNEEPSQSVYPVGEPRVRKPGTGRQEDEESSRSVQYAEAAKTENPESGQ